MRALLFRAGRARHADNFSGWSSCRARWSRRPARRAGRRRMLRCGFSAGPSRQEVPNLAIARLNEGPGRIVVVRNQPPMRSTGCPIPRQAPSRRGPRNQEAPAAITSAVGRLVRAPDACRGRCAPRWRCGRGWCCRVCAKYVSKLPLRRLAAFKQIEAGAGQAD